MIDVPFRLRSAWFLRGAALVVLAACGARGAAGADGAAEPPVRAVAEIGMTVANLDRSIAFYTDALAFEKLIESEASGREFGRIEGLGPDTRARTARLKLGDEWIELTEYRTPAGQPFPADSQSNDRWFQHIAIIVSDIERAHARLMQRHVQPATRGGPQRLPEWNSNAAGIKAFYFRDPDGHFLEILEFPPGKGDARWRRQTDRLFLGIDHTAIVVGDTEASLRFYRDTLGLAVVGGSENYGVEQENLNNVPGARLRITTLRAAAGPGIELLEYLSPRDGRPYPADARPNDVLHWQTTLVARDAADLAATLRSAGTRFVSEIVEAAPRQSPATSDAFIVRDPDGHALKIVGS